MTSDQIAAVGAFLSGAGSILGAWFVLKRERKRMQAECEERVRLLKEGIEIGERLDDVHPRQADADRDR